MIVICVSSYGECIMPNKVLNKTDCYQGHWKDGKIHGFGKYRSVNSLLLLFQLVGEARDS